MTQLRSPHMRAALQALFVTFLWSTSWVLIKIGLKDDIPALTFAGLRYVLAFLCLLPFALRPAQRTALKSLPKAGWARLIALGVIYYAVTQGTQFLGLAYLPSATASLMLSFTVIAVALASAFFLSERITALQWGGVILTLIGAVIYFYPVEFSAEQITGLIVMTISLLANAAGSILGRYVNRQQDLSPLTVTVVSMGIGAILLLVIGLATQGLPPLSLGSWLLIVWMAVVNTALAFTLWNHTLRTLPATESTIINNTMLIQIAVLAWIFLGESLSWQEIGGLMVVVIGTLIVQARRAPVPARVKASPTA